MAERHGTGQPQRERGRERGGQKGGETEGEGRKRGNRKGRGRKRRKLERKVLEIRYGPKVIPPTSFNPTLPPKSPLLPNNAVKS